MNFRINIFIAIIFYLGFSSTFRFNGLPLNIVIAVRSRELTLKRELTISGLQYVQFGWDGEIEIKQNK